MNRRGVSLLLLTASALVCAPALAQQPVKVWRVGFLSLTPLSQESRDAFVKAMRDLGYGEGRNLVIEWRDGQGDFDRLPGLAVEFVQAKVDAILAVASGPIGAAQRATATIPIVMVTTGDPVGSGFVQSLAHPGGNITGLSNMNSETGAKQVELLATVVPKLARLGVLVTPTSPTHRAIRDSVQAGARGAGIATVVAEASTVAEIDAAFERFAKEKAGAVVVGSAPLFSGLRVHLGEIAVKYRLPTIHGNRLYVDAGGLMSYGQSLLDAYARVAAYVDKIFRGVKPADLPVQQPRAFELVINQRTAKALGLAIPREVLLRANAVIE